MKKPEDYVSNRQFKFVSIGIGVALTALVSFYFLCLNHVDFNEVGVAYNSGSGEMHVQTNAGWYVTSPLVKVVSLPTIPTKVMLITPANIIASKIVKLRQDKVVEFVKMQGFGYMMRANFSQILMGYAFSGKSYEFLEVVQDSTVADNK